MDSLPECAYLTADLPGIGGVLKQRPEDFLVEEQPLYQPAGSGEHLYLFIEKRERSTSDVVRHLARTFWVSRRDVGYAGLKDKHAITRQHFSIHLPRREEVTERMKQVDSEQIRLLWSDWHTNKLRRGHHAGNRFVIYVRQVDPLAVVSAKRILDRLVREGAPNYLGEQRFGYRRDNHVLGRLLLLGQWQAFLDKALGEPRPTDYELTRRAREAYAAGNLQEALALWPRHLRHDRQALDTLRQGKGPREAVLAIDPQQREYLISALQSAVFNQVLDRRIRDGWFAQLVAGDLAWKHDSRAVFAVDEATAMLENAPDGRVARHEVSPSGPMWGVEMTRAGGAVGALEKQALEEAGLREEDLAGGPQGRAGGVRRPMRQFILDPQVSGGVDEHGPYIRVAFELGRGSFATVALRELMKNPAAAEGSDDEQE